MIRLFFNERFLLGRAVTGLKNRYSTALYGLFDPLAQGFLYEPESLLFFVIHGDSEHFLHFGSGQCDDSLLRSHERIPEVFVNTLKAVQINRSLYFNIAGPEICVNRKRESLSGVPVTLRKAVLFSKITDA